MRLFSLSQPPASTRCFMVATTPFFRWYTRCSPPQGKPHSLIKLDACFRVFPDSRLDRVFPLLVVPPDGSQELASRVCFILLLVVCFLMSLRVCFSFLAPDLANLVSDIRGSTESRPPVYPLFFLRFTRIRLAMRIHFRSAFGSYLRSRSPVSFSHNSFGTQSLFSYYLLYTD